MECNNCKYYSEVRISFLYKNNIETDMGIRNIECLKMKNELIEKKLLTNQKRNKTCVIGSIKVFDVNELKYLIPEIKEINTPDWCPKRKKG